MGHENNIWRLICFNYINNIKGNGLCVVCKVTLSSRLGRYSLRSHCKRPSTIDLKGVKYLHIIKNVKLFQVNFKEIGPTQVV